MALIITGIFIQLVGLAVQLIQLRQGRSDDAGAQAPVPGAGPGRRDEAEAAVGNEANEHARQAITKTASLDHDGTAQACLELYDQESADD
jgi:hypothetical protein